jgi:hypothetical protein
MFKNMIKKIMVLGVLFSTPILTAQATLKNGDFEKGNRYWKSESHENTVGFPKEEGYKNSRAGYLQQTRNNKIPIFSQDITGLTVGKTYLASAWVKAESIMVEKGKIGANIGIRDTWTSSGEGLTGTFDWKRIEFSFQALSPVETLELRLGFWNNHATGKVWFDNVEVVELDVFVAESPKKYIRIHVPKRFIREDQYDVVQNWVAKLDEAYEAYVDLIGKAPYEGKTIDIQVAVQNLPGAWAWAGNPVYWTGRFVPEELDFIEQGSWSFGIMHELAHDFAFTSDAYNWNEEMLCNFRMFYALEKTGAKVNTRGKMYSSPEVKDYYRTLCGDDFCDDYVLHYTIVVKEEIGWDAFKQAFRKLEGVKKDESLGNYQKYRLFIETAANQVGMTADDVLSKVAWKKIRTHLKG